MAESTRHRGLNDAFKRARALHMRLTQILDDRLATAEPDERPLEVIAQIAVLDRALGDLRETEARLGHRHDRTVVAYLLSLLECEP